MVVALLAQGPAGAGLEDGEEAESQRRSPAIAAVVPVLKRRGRAGMLQVPRPDGSQDVGFGV